MGVKQFLQKQLVQLGHFIYNPKTKEIFGRTGLSWIQILAYLTVLYIFLAALLAAHIYLFVAVTPGPAPDVRPWNFGRYAYPNYPNAKIALISQPSAIKFNTSMDENILNKLKQATKMQDLTCGLNNDTRNCVFIYVARTFDWTPELIDSHPGNYLAINCSVDKANYTVYYSPSLIGGNITSLSGNINITGGIPLNLPNNVDSTNTSHSFPYRGQTNFTLPVVSVWIDGPLPSSLLTVTCSVPSSSIKSPVFSNNTMQSRIYEYPNDVKFTVGQ